MALVQSYSCFPFLAVAVGTFEIVSTKQFSVSTVAKLLQERGWL